MSNFVNLLDIVYPVGSVYITFSDVSPVDSVGGSWEKIDGKFLQSSSEIDSLNSTGGTSNLLTIRIGYASFNGGIVTSDNSSVDYYLINMSGVSPMKYEQSFTQSQWSHDGNSGIAAGYNLKSRPIMASKSLSWDNRPAYITCNMYRRTA